MWRILRQVHLFLLCFKGLAKLLDPWLGPANTIHALRQRPEQRTDHGSIDFMFFFYHHFGPCTDKSHLHREGTMLNLRCALQYHKGDLILLITRDGRKIHPKHRPLSVLTLKLTRLHTLPVQSQSTLRKKQTKARPWLHLYSSGSSAPLSSVKLYTSSHSTPLTTI